MGAAVSVFLLVGTDCLAFLASLAAADLSAVPFTRPAGEEGRLAGRCRGDDGRFS